MAANKPFGLSPVFTIGTGGYNARATRYLVPSADGSIYSMGDPVKSAANADANGVPAVQKLAAGTDTIRGVYLGFELASVNNPSLQGVVLDATSTNLPATKTRNYYVFVQDDPATIFAIQDDGITGGNLVAANANKNFSLTLANPAGNQQVSATVMLSSSLATTAGLNFKAFGLQQLPGNVFGAFGVWLCKANQHELQGNTAGI